MNQQPRSNSLTRRSFVNASVLAAAAPLTLRAANALPPARYSKPLKIGLVGCGGRGTGAALNALLAEPGTVVLTALADIFPDRIESCLSSLTQELDTYDPAYVPPPADGSKPVEASAPSKELTWRNRVQVPVERRFTGFDAYAKLLATDIDAVLLCTVPHFRPLHVAAAVAADKHIFCEKPLAVDVPGLHEAMAAIELARAKQLSFVSGFCWRYNVRHRALFQRIHEQHAIGAVRAIYTNYLTSTIFGHPRQPAWSDLEWQLRNWHHFHWLSGDHIVEQAVHSLDKMSWAMRDVPPLSCVAVGGRQAREGAESGNSWDHFSVIYDYADGVKGFHATRQINNCSNDNSDWIWGEKGNAFINGWAPLHRIDGAEPWTYEGEGNDMYQQEHDEFFASIRSGKPLNDGSWMATSTLLAIMGRMAAYTGQTIRWEQALNSKERLGPATLDFAAKLEIPPVAIPGKTQFV